MSSIFTFYSPGKLLLSGEYLILCGAKGLAVPTRFGQWMRVQTLPEGRLLQWKALLQDGSLWFEAHFSLPDLVCIYSTDPQKSGLLEKLLPLAQKKLGDQGSLRIETQLEFDPAFGLGSSSTFIANFAQWAELDPYALLKNTFGGSGYDVAVGMSQSAIVYRLVNDLPEYQTVPFSPKFKDDLLFVYSGQKRVSREAIGTFSCASIDPNHLQTITELTEKMLHCSEMSSFEALIEQHESLMGQILGTPPLKEHFPDFPGAVKSLGAWGGDFFLVTRKNIAKTYFSNKGYSILFDWNELIK